MLSCFYSMWKILCYKNERSSENASVNNSFFLLSKFRKNFHSEKNLCQYCKTKPTLSCHKYYIMPRLRDHVCLGRCISKYLTLSIRSDW